MRRLVLLRRLATFPHEQKLKPPLRPTLTIHIGIVVAFVVDYIDRIKHCAWRRGRAAWWCGGGVVGWWGGVVVRRIQHNAQQLRWVMW